MPHPSAPPPAPAGCAVVAADQKLLLETNDVIEIILEFADDIKALCGLRRLSRRWGDCVTAAVRFANGSQCQTLGLDSEAALRLHFARNAPEVVARASAVCLRARLKELEHLIVSGSDISDRCIDAFAIASPRLRKFNAAFALKITDESITTIAKNCRQLQFLNVHQTTITHVGITAIATGCKQLLHLDVGFTNVTDEGVIAIAKACKKLEYLNVGNTDRITNNSITAIAKNCKQLRLLDVSCTGDYIDDQGLIAIAKNCPQLQYLNASGTKGITNDSITPIATGCKRLLHLDMSCTGDNITDQGLIAIAKACPRLQYLSVRKTNRITTASITAIAAGCKQLLHLDMSCTGDYITDQGLIAIAKNCPHLQCLIVAETAIPDVCLTAIAEGCHLLQHLEMNHAQNVNDEELTAIAESCHLLQHLEMNQAQNVTDIGLIAIAKGCPLLQHLEMNQAQNVTDIGLIAIGKGCPLLQHLEMKQARDVTDSVFAAFAQGCHFHLGDWSTTDLQW